MVSCVTTPATSIFIRFPTKYFEIINTVKSTTLKVKLLAPVLLKVFAWVSTKNSDTSKRLVPSHDITGSTPLHISIFC